MLWCLFLCFHVKAGTHFSDTTAHLFLCLTCIKLSRFINSCSTPCKSLNTVYQHLSLHSISNPHFLSIHWPVALTPRSLILSLLISSLCSSFSTIQSLTSSGLILNIFLMSVFHQICFPSSSSSSISLSPTCLSMQMSPQVFALLIVPKRGKLWSHCPVK